MTGLALLVIGYTIAGGGAKADQTAENAWRQHLADGRPIALTENGSARGLEVVPAIAVNNQASQIEAGKWVLIPYSNRDPVTGAPLPGDRPLYLFQSLKYGHFLALVDGRLAVADHLAADPRLGRIADIQWEILPGELRPAQGYDDAGRPISIEVPVNFHIRHAATGQYIFLQNGYIYVTPSQATPWVFAK